MLDLPKIYDLLDESIKFKLDQLDTTSIEERGPICDYLDNLFRAAAIAELLLKFDDNGFHHMLYRSGMTRVYLLSLTPEQDKATSRYCRITKSAGFFDAVACGQIAIARQIVELSPRTWNDKFEYEDDFCYVRFLHGVCSQSDEAVLREIVERFDEILGGDSSERLDLCRALLEPDDSSFADAFDALLDVRAEEIEAERTLPNRDDIQFAGGKDVFIEGLALLKLAESLGISTDEEYTFCPAEARSTVKEPYPTDGYPTIG